MTRSASGGAAKTPNEISKCPSPRKTTDSRKSCVKCADMDELFPSLDPLMPAPPPWWMAYAIAAGAIAALFLLWLGIRVLLNRPPAPPSTPAIDLRAAATTALAEAAQARTQSAAASAAAAIRAYLDSHGIGGARSRTAAEMTRWRAARDHTAWLEMLARCETLACMPAAPDANWQALAAAPTLSIIPPAQNPEVAHAAVR